jgi:hypothetical protein
VTNLPPYLYARQFVAGPADAVVPNLSSRITVDHDLKIAHHVGLEASKVEFGGRTLVCLGHLIDHRNPTFGNTQVLERTAERATTFETLEAELARLGGRWMMFASIGGERRLYPDAVGTRSIFYANVAGKGVWAASQPRVLVDAIGVAVDHNRWSQFVGAPFGDSWPAAAVPYVGVRQLQPNHYLDLRSGDAKRFWPTASVPARNVDDAADAIAKILHDSMDALVHRGSVAMAMTAGYDTRTLFASAAELRPRLRFFLVQDPGVAWHEVSIAKRVTRRFKQPLTVVRARRYDDTYWSTLQRNVGGLWWDPGDFRIFSFGAMQERFMILSLMSEVMRCFHYKEGNHPTDLTAEKLAAMAKYPDNPVAIAAFGEWRAGLPKDININELDLFFWENRLGNWASLLFTAMDSVTEVVNPYNCRELLEIGLGVDEKSRCSPYLLHKRICERTEPDTMRDPFNRVWQEAAWAPLAEIVPWRIQAWTRRTKMRVAGFEWPRKPSPTRG